MRELETRGISDHQLSQISLTKTPKMKVDLVITYVDGSDPDFQAALKKYMNETKKALLPLAIAKSRFHNHDDLRYLFRSIEDYGSIFNRIFLVVSSHSGQVPNWLVQSHPRLRIVRHEEIWYDKSQLPTFNSFAIEANLAV